MNESGFDNDAHARFQRMLLGEPEPEPTPKAGVPPLADTPAAAPSLPPQASPPAAVAAAPPTHVDVNAGLAPSPPAATPPPPPLSAASKPLPSQPQSMVFIIQDQWVQLCDYFQRVQCANTTEERLTLVRELGVVETSLNTILDALLTDRKQLVSTQLLHTHMSIFGESMPSDVGVVTPVPAGAQDGDTQKMAAAAAATSSTPSPSSGFLLDGALSSLPPCYRFLFADAHRDDVPLMDSSDEDKTDAAPRHTHGAVATTAAGAAGKLYDDPSPIGSIFLLTLCQYAKQDEPPGVRSIILEFLVRLLQEADLPTDRAAYPAGDPVLSLLQLNPPLLIVPLLDMLRKVSKALDPSKTALKHGSASLTSSPMSYPWLGGDDQDGTFLQDAGRTQFVIFLSSLAEKMERVPALANFFVVEDGAEGERNLFVLLDALLPYLTHDCSAPGWTHRRDTCRYALSAVVSLAKCPDPWIQDLVGKEAQVTSRTLMAARTTLLTLCKIPDNDDSTTQVLFLRDVLRFWATLTTMSPTVADGLQLYPAIEKEFFFQTLLPLLQSSDTHVYSAACLVVAQLLRELNGSAPLLSKGLANALLATTIRKSSGRIVPRVDHYDSAVVDDGGPGKAKASATTLGQQEELAASSLQMHQNTSFFLYYILPHLSSNPYLSEEERQNGALLGYSTTRWSTVKATLVLTQALAENVPEVFMRQVFLMDITSLADVLRKQRQCAAAAPSAGASPKKTGNSSDKKEKSSSKGVNAGAAAAAATTAVGDNKGGADDNGGDDARIANLGLWSTAAAPPHLRVHDYFVKELHESTTAHPALGLQAEQVGEAVLTRLLRTEGNMSIDALRARQQVMSAMTQQSVANKVVSAGSSVTSASNCWVHAGVLRSPLTVALCEMVQHLDATPFTVSSLVADLVVSLCVLPDLRVVYTFLDPLGGPLKVALCQLRDVLQHRIKTTSADVSAFSAARKGGATAAAASGASLPPAASASSPHSKSSGISLLILYDMLLQHWDALNSEETVTHHHPSNSTNKSRNSSFSAVASAGPAQEPDVALQSLRDAVAANSNVLHACLYSEYLLAHLDAAIGYTALSQNLMYLRTTL